MNTEGSSPTSGPVKTITAVVAVLTALLSGVVSLVRTFDDTPERKADLAYDILRERIEFLQEQTSATRADVRELRSTFILLQAGLSAASPPLSEPTPSPSAERGPSISGGGGGGSGLGVGLSGLMGIGIATTADSGDEDVEWVTEGECLEDECDATAEHEESVKKLESINKKLNSLLVEEDTKEQKPLPPNLNQALQISK